MTMNRESVSEMYFLVSDIGNTTNIRYWFSEHVLLIVMIILVIIGIVVAIFLIPSKRKKEQRENKMADQIRKENYNPDVNGGVKIDQEAIDKIGAVEKQIDMTQAIVYNEDVKPFGDIIGKSDAVIEPSTDNQFNQNNISVFENRNPDNYNNSESKVDELAQINIPLSANNSELKPIMVEEITDASTEINGFDPFNAQVEIPTSNMTNPQNNGVSPNIPATSESIELPEKKENLGVINPQMFEEVTHPEENIDMPKLDEKNE